MARLEEGRETPRGKLVVADMRCPRCVKMREGTGQMPTGRKAGSQYPRVLQSQVRALPELRAGGVGRIPDEHQAAGVTLRQRHVEVAGGQELPRILNLIEQ